ncbi:MAG TPA: hypothetical protein VJH55_00270 [Candidatus Paceibacterota bacterium]
MIELATSLALMINAVTTKGQPAETITSKEVKTEQTVNQPHTLESYVREYFKNTPQLAHIAGCESTFKHLDKAGKIIRGRVNSSDVGVMQINEWYHLEQSKKLWIDIYTLEGNLEYAKLLYGKSGSAPWVSSSKCWNKLGGELAKK